MEYKDGLAAILITLFLTSTTLPLLSTTSAIVSAQAAPTVTLTPLSVRDNAYVAFEIVVTNPLSSENIENVLLKDETTGVASKFSGGIGGENTADNIENVADNLIAAGNQMDEVTDNIRTEHLVEIVGFEVTTL